MKYNKKRFHYLIKTADMKETYIRASFEDLKSTGYKPINEDLVNYEKELRIIKNLNNGYSYYLLPFSTNFNNAMAGAEYCFCYDDLYVELEDIKYEHNL